MSRKINEGILLKEKDRLFELYYLDVFANSLIKFMDSLFSLKTTTSYYF